MQAYSVPDSSVFSPVFNAHATLAAGSEKFDNATATVLFTVRRGLAFHGGQS